MYFVSSLMIITNNINENQFKIIITVVSINLVIHSLQKRSNHPNKKPSSISKRFYLAEGHP